MSSCIWKFQIIVRVKQYFSLYVSLKSTSFGKNKKVNMIRFSSFMLSFDFEGLLLFYVSHISNISPFFDCLTYSLLVYTLSINISINFHIYYVSFIFTASNLPSSLTFTFVRLLALLMFLFCLTVIMGIRIKISKDHFPTVTILSFPIY